MQSDSSYDLGSCRTRGELKPGERMSRVKLQFCLHAGTGMSFGGIGNSVTATLAGHLRLRLLLVPLGRIPEEKMRSFAQEIQAVSRCIDFASLTPSLPKDTLFTSLSRQRSKIRFDTILTQPATIPGEWDDLHPHKRIIAVLGIVHCPSSPDLEAVYAEFQDLQRRLSAPGRPGPLQFSCYAFEPLENQADPNKESLIVFPNQGRDRLRFYLSTCINDLAIQILEAFEHMVRGLHPAEYWKAPLPQETNADASRQKRFRQGRKDKFIGDICLLAGAPVDAIKYYRAALDATKSNSDWLWHGATLEAMAAALLSLQLEERALAGPASPLSPSSPSSTTSSSSSSSSSAASDANEKILELLSDALVSFSKVPYSVVPTVEANIKMARFYAKCGRCREASDVLLRLQLLRGECGAQDQIALAVESALICDAMGFKRKFGHYLLQAATLYRELHNYAAAHSLLLMALPAFGVDKYDAGSVGGRNRRGSTGPSRSPSATPLLPVGGGTEADTVSQQQQAHARNSDSNSSGDGEGKGAERKGASEGQTSAQAQEDGGSLLASSQRRRERGLDAGAWHRLQRPVLEQLVRTAKRLPEKTKSAAAIAHLLAGMHGQMDQETQRSLAADLWSCTRMLPLNTQVNLTGLPVVLKIRPIIPSAAYTPHLERARSNIDGNEEDDSEVFLFDPGAEQQAGGGRKLHPIEVAYVSREVVDFQVTLSNPFKFEIVIQVKQPPAILIYVFPLEIPSLFHETASYPVLLSGKPLQPGRLDIRGVHIRTFNLMWEHRVDGIGIGVEDAKVASVALDSGASCLTTAAEAGNGGGNGSASLAVPPVNVRGIRVTAAVPQLMVKARFDGNAEGRLLIGETRTLFVSLENTGELPVGALQLSIRELYLPGTDHSQDAYYTEEELALMAEQEREEEEGRDDDAEGDEESEEGEQEGGEAGDGRRRRGAGSRAQRRAGRRRTNSRAASFWVQRPRRLVEWEEGAAERQAPIGPGKAAVVPLRVFAHPACCGIEVTVRYRERPESLLYRVIQQTFPWSVSHGISVQSVEICPFDPALSPPPSSSSSSSSAPSSSRHRTRGTGDRQFASRVQSKEVKDTEAPRLSSRRGSRDLIGMGTVGPSETSLAAGASSSAAPTPSSPRSLSRAETPLPAFLLPSASSSSLGPDAPPGDAADPTLPPPLRTAGSGVLTGTDELARSLERLASLSDSSSAGAATSPLPIPPGSDGTRNVFAGATAAASSDLPQRRRVSLPDEDGSAGYPPQPRRPHHRRRRSQEQQRREKGDRCMLIVEVENSADTTFRLYLRVDGVEKKTQGAFIEKRTSKRAILPLRRFWFGAANNEALRRLALQLAAAPEDEELRREALHSRAFLRCCALFHQRVQLLWHSADETTGHVIPSSLDLTPEKLFRLVPDPVAFHFSTDSPASTLSSFPSSFDGDGTTGRDYQESAPSVFEEAAQESKRRGCPLGLQEQSLEEEEYEAEEEAEEREGGDVEDGRSCLAMQTVALEALLEMPSSAASEGSTARQGFTISSPLLFPVGDFQPLVVTVTNRTERPLALDLSLRPCHEQRQPAAEDPASIERKLFWAGSLGAALPVLRPGGSYRHEVTLCFLASGRYSLTASCCKRKASKAPSSGEERKEGGTTVPVEMVEAQASGLSDVELG